MEIRVLVVDDSAVMRSAWSRVLNQDQSIVVVATAEDGMQAIEVLRKKVIDIVVMDLEMPRMDGITAIRIIHKEFPRVRTIVASAATTQGSKKAIEALTAGASDYICKARAVGSSEEFRRVADLLIEKIHAFSGSDQSALAPIKIALPKSPIIGPKARFAPEVILIGSSTGGPNAVSEMLGQISVQMSLPILIVQHMPPMFTTLLARRLGEESGRVCEEAKDGELIRRGRIYLAPGDYHMTVEKERETGEARLRVRQFDPENYCRPAVDPLFRTGAEVYGKGALAIVMTGMGEDGKLGAREIVRRGGVVIAQDEQTSVVWGMPGAVVNDGTASEVLPLGEIAGRLNDLCI